MKFLRIREAGERQIIVDVAKSDKRPILNTLVVDVDEWKFHQCGNCVYNTDCHSECKVLEASYPIREFVKEKFKVNLHELCLVPINKIRPRVKHKYEIPKF
jgi:hypothetical protein